MFESSHIELSLGALRKNLAFLKRQLPEGAIFCSVIKGNAYGHGVQHFVPMAERCGLRQFAVFSAEEALATEASLTRPDSQILILGAIPDEALAWATEHRIAFYVFDLDRLKAAGRAARKTGRPARIHLELETGLNRTGLNEGDLKRAVRHIQKHPARFQVEGVCTHFAGAESIGNYLRIQRQIERFQTGAAWLAGQDLPLGERGLLRHSACSAAALTMPQTIGDMARIGIAQYGFWPSKETEVQYRATHPAARRRGKRFDPLKRIIKWSSRVMGVKKVARGDFVGYGTLSLVTRQIQVAAIPVGYFHGFHRELSNKGHVLIRGQRAPVVGLVNMHMMMVDVTEIPGVRRGDEVVIIGRQGDKAISVGSFGELTRFLNYEILVGLPSEIPRLVVD